jgi:sialate O-acetylesterase
MLNQPVLFRWCAALVAGVVALAQLPARAEVRLPKVFASHMVLQQEKPIQIWGWAQPDESVTIELAGARQQVRANAKGEWKATLPAIKAGGPFELVVTGSSTVKCEDVMVGEVWLCSGQSNMEMGIKMCRNAQEEIAAANHPEIRLLLVPNRWTPEPQADMEGRWKRCTPESVADDGWGGFSAAAYYFGRELQQKLGVAIGLIDATWGGTLIQPWTPPEGFAAVPALQHDYELVQLGDPHTPAHRQRLEKTLNEFERWLSAAREAMSAEKIVPAVPGYPSELLPPHDVQNATALYNGMIHPLQPFALRGAIWYQGESNSREGMLYTERMKGLIGGWRQLWGEGDFPFYFVQIAPFDYKTKPDKIGEFWEAQAAAAQVIPNCGMAVINDIGDLKDIHPTNKQEVGRRLALLALAGAYGRADVVCSGPTFKQLQPEGNLLRVTFDHAAGGLASRDGKPLTWFEIIDADEGGFVTADARIDGASVVLSAAGVKRPVAMRFAWSMLAEPNLMNAAGLPAGAFRAGDAPKRDLLATKVPEAKSYELVYDLDLAKLGSSITYDVDNHEKINKPFDRIAYFLELGNADGRIDYLFVSMDAFTDQLRLIGVPTAKSGARFQRPVANMNVYSNVKDVVTGTGLAGGNLEFWPNNYGPTNAENVPNASDQVYDFGDQPSDPVEGHGSMQVHNHDARQTLFALNNWRAGSGADLGIGNRPKDQPDWTFASNAGSYELKRLRVLVRCR